MTITADYRTYLGHICMQVAKMKPGECLEVDIYSLRDIPSFEHNGATFSPADRVLGNIVGSAYTHSFDVNPMQGTVTFRRHENTGERRYKDPDHDIRLAWARERAMIDKALQESVE
jgi:hypothetical protein